MGHQSASQLFANCRERLPGEKFAGDRAIVCQEKLGTAVALTCSRMRRTYLHRLPAALVLSLGISLCACAAPSRFVNQIYRRGDIAYRVGALPSAWQQVAGKGADLAFRRRDGGTIATSSQCLDVQDVPLDVLTNHLLFGVERQQERRRTPFTLDGRAALRTHLGGEVDGVPVELDLVVLKKDGCVYDLQLIAAVPQLARCQADFEAFMQGFGTLPGK
jgi:hypothetical protein